MAVEIVEIKSAGREIGPWWTKDNPDDAMDFDQKKFMQIADEIGPACAQTLGRICSVKSTG